MIENIESRNIVRIGYGFFNDVYYNFDMFNAIDISNIT